jgi:hypothetical protein
VQTNPTTPGRAQSLRKGNVMHKSNRRRFMPVSLIAIACSVGALGCATAPPPPPTADKQITITCLQPNTTPLQETKEMQTKGGIQIIVAMQPFQCEKAVKERSVASTPDFTEAILASKTHPGEHYVETTRTPYFLTKPDRLKVTLKIVNQLSRVFRGAGGVVQFTVAGKTWANKQEDYAEFSNAIIPPRGEQQIEIYGPPTEAIPAQANIGLFLYDVVTKTDQAGNIVEKQNFEWYYSYGLQTKEESAPVQVSTGWVGR